MLNNNPNKTDFIERFDNSFNTVTRCAYDKTSPGSLPELNTHCEALEQLAEEHPNHPAIAQLFRENIPLLVCVLDYLNKQAARTAAADAEVNQKLQRLLRLYDRWSTGWLKAFMPADCKVPEAFVTRERPQLSADYEIIDKTFTQLAFKLPAAMALEVVLVLIQAPADEVITYSQWQYAQQLTTHIQQVLGNPIVPATEERVIETLLAFRYNTGRFSMWFTQHLKDALQQAGSMAEKKST